jgi:hypothetical protein
MKEMLQKFKLSLAMSGFLVLPQMVFAQMDVIITPSLFQGGYNVSCNGGTDGRITAVAVGETGPFFYVWSNGATTSEITGLPAGIYTVTVTKFTVSGDGSVPTGGGIH